MYVVDLLGHRSRQRGFVWKRVADQGGSVWEGEHCFSCSSFFSCVRCTGTTGQHAAQAPILSWQEAGKPEEERGKVGEGWPWDEESEDKTRHD
jgi:hypothetical protein